MKTDTETLRKRGFLTNTEAEPYFLYSKEELLELLKDKTAVNRTAALFILRSFVDINELDEILLRMLVKEKALYTKLEICDILTTGNELTIKRMIPYMGTIRGNQHRTIPEKVSKKKSYPVSKYPVERMVTLEHLRELVEQAEQQDIPAAELLDPLLMPMDSPASDYPVVNLPLTSSVYFKNGNPVVPC